MRPVWLRLAIVAIATCMLVLPGASAAPAASATSGTFTDGDIASDPCPQLDPGTSGTSGAGEAGHVADPCVYPVISLGADPASVEYGGWSTIHWSVANAMHGCTNWSNPSTNFGGITGAGSGSVSVGPLYANTTFHVRCDNGNGAVAENYTGVSVAAPPPPSPPPPPPCPNVAPDAAETVEVSDVTTCVYPLITLSADPSSVAYGGWSTIHWSVTNAANGCTNWSNPSTNFGGIAGAGSGSVSVGPLYSNTTFHVRCDNGNGAIAENYTGVSVGAPPPPPPPDIPPPTAQLSASPSTIALGAATTLTWSSSNASSCSTSWAGAQAASGSHSLAPVETTTYTVSCNGASAATTVTVTPPPPQPAYYEGLVTADVLRHPFVFRLGCASVGDGVRRIKGDGRLIWRYGIRILEFCWNGLSITRLNGVEVVEERVQPPFPFSLYQSITYKEENRNVGETGGRVTVVSVSGRFEYCGAGFLCIPIGNPWIRIELSATGQATCTTSVRTSRHSCFRW